MVHRSFYIMHCMLAFCHMPSESNKWCAIFAPRRAKPWHCCTAMYPQHQTRDTMRTIFIQGRRQMFAPRRCEYTFEVYFKCCWWREAMLESSIIYWRQYPANRPKFIFQVIVCAHMHVSLQFVSCCPLKNNKDNPLASKPLFEAILHGSIHEHSIGYSK
jgi:hypothetical protein